MGRRVRFITSRRLALWLLAMIALASAGGVTLKGSEVLQNLSPESFLLSPAVKLQDVFHSWWFVTMLVVLALSLLICTLQRVNIKKAESLPTGPAGWDFRLKAEGEKLQARLEKVLGRPKAIKREGNVVWLTWQREALANWGSRVFHFSMVLILLGGAVNGLWSYEGNILLSEGEERQISASALTGLVKGPFAAVEPGEGTVELKEFATRFYDGILASQYEGVLKFTSSKGEQQQSIAVNRNGKFNGLMWRYKRHGYAPRIVLQRQGEQVLRAYLNLNDIDHGAASRAVKRYVDIFEVQKGLGLQVEFFQDFDPDRGFSTSNLPNNPVAKLEIGKLTETDKGAEVQVENSLLLKPGETKEAGGWETSFLDWRYWVLIEVSYYPGGRLLDIGLVLCALGIVARFLFPPRQVYARLGGEEGWTRVSIWSRAGNLNQLFQAELNQKLVKGGITGAGL